MGSIAGAIRMLRKRRTAKAADSVRVSAVDRDDEVHLYLQALAQSGDAVVITNGGGVIEYVNAAFERISGYTSAEAVGASPSLVKSGAHDQGFYQRLWETLRQGRSFRSVFINRAKNGLLYHEEKTVSPIVDRGGDITHFVSTGRNVNSRIATENQLHRLAYYDSLTSLPNRKLFLTRLEEYLESGTATSRGVLLLLDINNLKKVNDTLGHPAGDQALRAITKRLQSFCCGTCTVGRWGGDEFTVVIPECRTREQAQEIAQSVLALMSQPLDLGGQEVFLSASVGGVCYSGSDAPEYLIRNADLAMHRAKEKGRNTFLFYQDSMRDNLHEDLTIESALHGALDRGEFHLLFQPMIRVTDDVMVGLEALLRWDSPLLEAVPTSRFISLIERSGMIMPVGRWVLETACRAIVDMQTTGQELLRVAVNVSARQLLHPHFISDVEAALAKSRLPAERLELEITETVLVENAEEAAEVLLSLHRLGVRVAADDFGTGYSPLSYLWKFPFSTLKIDRAFVAQVTVDERVPVIIKSILGLAQGMGLDVIVEGVETEEQMEVLSGLGCRQVQGYLTGRPLSLAAIKALEAAPSRTSLSAKVFGEEVGTWI